MTKFSIITITKNNEAGFSRTVNSLRAQSFHDFEHIVVDGVLEPDSGIYDAMNKGLGRANGDYILFLNAGAGGATYFADMDRAFVVYPDGSAQPLSVSMWKQSVTMIPPGSTIIVPRDPKPFDFLESAEKISTILANIALTGFYIDDLGDDD